ncbi:MAG: TIGR02281 family clan AA aspartic protease [Gammaproteobacteria bacterium]
MNTLDAAVCGRYDLHSADMPGIPMNRFLKTLLLCVLLSPVSTLAAPVHVRVVGLFSGKAVMMVNGQRYVLSEGESTPEGLRLIEASSSRAVVELNGEKRVLRLDNRVGVDFAQQKTETARAYRDPSGLYTTVGAINGQPVNFLVDTGANVVTLNSADASRLGIDVNMSGQLTLAQTASNIVHAYRVTLNTVTVGGLTRHHVTAVVMPGNEPSQPLLGMSFLSHFHLQREGNAMLIQTR